MYADVEGALANIKNSWRFFIHRDLPMTQRQVRAVLEYAIQKGYKYIHELTDQEVDKIILDVEL